MRTLVENLRMHKSSKTCQDEGRGRGGPNKLGPIGVGHVEKEGRLDGKDMVLIFICKICHDQDMILTFKKW